MPLDRRRRGRRAAARPWTTLGDLQESPVLSACSGQWDRAAEGGDAKRPERWRVVGADAASWSGVLGRTAWDAYERGPGARVGTGDEDPGADEGR
ncbi:hypothetical protein NKH77_36265 [Streptomyces sp. M19]